VLSEMSHAPTAAEARDRTSRSQYEMLRVSDFFMSKSLTDPLMCALCGAYARPVRGRVGDRSFVS